MTATQPGGRGLVSAAALYGLADLVVMAVGGFLLLPLYTRTLSQAEFGTYIVVRTNSEIFTYLMALGLPSAVARVYFDYRARGQEIAYLNSILGFFLLSTAVIAMATLAWGASLWQALSPEVPAWPYLWFCLGMAGLAFLTSLSSLWFRLEERAAAVGLQQVGTAALLILLALVNLVVLRTGLIGLLWALLASSGCSALALPWLFGRRLRPVIRWRHIADSIPYAAPILLGYVAYFILNRVNTIILQRHVGLAEIAIFGLAQQLSLIVSISGAAFGKAVQPAVFGASAEQAQQVLNRAARAQQLSLFGIASVLIIFAAEIVHVIGSTRYRTDSLTVAILVTGSCLYSFSLVSNTSLLYHRRPRTSLLTSLAGALMSASFGLLLIPRYHIEGAALATAIASMGTSLLSDRLASRLSGFSFLRPMLATALAGALLAVLVQWIEFSSLGWWLQLLEKGSIALLVLAVLVMIYRQQDGAAGVPA